MFWMVERCGSVGGESGPMGVDCWEGERGRGNILLARGNLRLILLYAVVPVSNHHVTILSCESIGLSENHLLNSRSIWRSSSQSLKDIQRRCGFHDDRCFED